MTFQDTCQICTILGDCVVDGQFCPPRFCGCARNGCVLINACVDNPVIRFPYGCDPRTQLDLDKGLVEKIEIIATYETDDGTIISFTFDTDNNSGEFDLTLVHSFDVTILAEHGVDLPEGIHNAEIYFTTTNNGRFLAAHFCMLVERPDYQQLAPPIINVDATCNFLEVSLDFGGNEDEDRTSDPVHRGRYFDYFVIDWGDENEETVTLTDGSSADHSEWVATHLYEEAGSYTINVRGCLDKIDDEDLCEDEICGETETELEVCRAKIPVSRIKVSSTGLVDLTNSFVQEYSVETTITDLQVEIYGTPDCATGALLASYGGSPTDAASHALITSGTVESAQIDVAAAITANGGSDRFCVVVTSITDSNGSEGSAGSPYSVILSV